MPNPAVAQYHWHADWGMTLSRSFIWSDDAGDPIDVSTYEATLTIRRAYNTDVLLLATSDPADGITMGTTDGVIDVSVPAQDLEFGPRYADGDYVFDIVIDTGGGSLTKLIEGPFTLHATVYDA